MKVKVFHYEIVKEIPLTSLNLIPFQKHPRLLVFFNKGTKCVSCKKVGTRLILGKNRRNELHWDVYTSNLTPLTVDHIQPKSKGGGEELENKQPMCCWCNFKKGNGTPRYTPMLNVGHTCKWPRTKNNISHSKKKK